MSKNILKEFWVKKKTKQKTKNQIKKIYEEIGVKKLTPVNTQLKGN
jgi:hypothetical protein